MRFSPTGSKLMLINVDEANLAELTVLYPSPCLKSVWKKSNTLFSDGLRGLITYLQETYSSGT